MLAIVTDSTCGLGRKEAEELGIDVLPVTYVADGTRYREGFVGENGDYDGLLRSAQKTATEAVRAHAFSRTFQRHLDAGRDVLCITLSSRLSGTYRSACEAAEACRNRLPQVEGGPQVAVIDSWGTAGALEFVLRQAQALARLGFPLADVATHIEHYRSSQEIVFSVPDIKVLRGSGRLGALSRSVATMLNRYPVLKLERGGIVKGGMVRGSRGVGRGLAELAPAGATEFVISHFGAREVETQQLFLALKQRFPHADIRVKDGGPVLACNIGLGSVGLSWKQIP